MAGHKIYSMKFSGVYPHYVAKAERKTEQEEVDEIITWLTNYSTEDLHKQIDNGVTMEEFDQAPKMNPRRGKGNLCVRVEDIKEPLMQEIRYMDKMIDELAKGKKMEKY